MLSRQDSAWVSAIALQALQADSASGNTSAWVGMIKAVLVRSQALYRETDCVVGSGPFGCGLHTGIPYHATPLL